jgi:hypothetical protein
MYLTCLAIKESSGAIWFTLEGLIHDYKMLKYIICKINQYPTIYII